MVRHNQSERSYSTLVLGAAQLGMDYGQTNIDGMPNELQAETILKAAQNSGVYDFDTARAYGESEKRIGSAISAAQDSLIRPITKLAPLPKNGRSLSPYALSQFVENSVFQSLYNLNIKKLPTLLLHRASYIHDYDGVMIEVLRRLRDDGYIDTIGVSVQTPLELEYSLEVPDIKHIQLPYNMLDGRWDDFFKRYDKPNDLTIHVRSVFLQGILLTGNKKLWPRSNQDYCEDISSKINYFVRKFKREDAADLCTAYVRGSHWVDGVVLGIENEEQLNRNIALFKNSELSSKDAEEIRSEFVNIPKTLLNPACW